MNGIRCPYCNSFDVKDMEPSYDWFGDDECVCQWDVICEHCGETYIVSEELKVISRIVAKDADDLENQLDSKEE